MKTVLLHDQPPPGNRNPREHSHSSSSAQRLGRGRISGLTLIAILTLGLGYLHFAGGTDSVSVPSGAHAGQLTLNCCNYATEQGAYAPIAERWSCPRIEPTCSRV